MSACWQCGLPEARVSCGGCGSNLCRECYELHRSHLHLVKVRAARPRPGISRIVVLGEEDGIQLLNFACECGCEMLLTRLKADETEPFPCPGGCGRSHIVRHAHVFGPYGCWCGSRPEAGTRLPAGEAPRRPPCAVKGNRNVERASLTKRKRSA